MITPSQLQMANMDIMARVPKAATAVFAAIGLLFITSKVVNYVILLLQLFILSGISVGTKQRLGNLVSQFDSFASTARRVLGLL